MNNLNLFVLSGVVVAGCGLSGCFPQYEYQPYVDSAGYGYEETPLNLSDSSYRVTFTGELGMSSCQVQRYLLRRAAELTWRNGYDYFIFVDDQENANTKGILGPDELYTQSDHQLFCKRSCEYEEPNPYKNLDTGQEFEPKKYLFSGKIKMLEESQDKAYNANMVLHCIPKRS